MTVMLMKGHAILTSGVRIVAKHASGARRHGCHFVGRRPIIKENRKKEQKEKKEMERKKKGRKKKKKRRRKKE